MSLPLAVSIVHVVELAVLQHEVIAVLVAETAVHVVKQAVRHSNPYALNVHQTVAPLTAMVDVTVHHFVSGRREGTAIAAFHREGLIQSIEVTGLQGVRLSTLDGGPFADEITERASRNQIARNIDVMLEQNPGLKGGLDIRDPERS